MSTVTRLNQIAAAVSRQAGRFYTYEEGRSGDITIFDPRGADVMFLQDSDARQLRQEIEKLDKVWEKAEKEGNGKVGPFKSYEEHLSVILDQYDI